MSSDRVAAHVRALDDERRVRQLHAEARAANAIGPGGGYRVLRAAGLSAIVEAGRLAVVLPLVPIRGPGMPGYFETPFFEDIEVLA